MNVNNLIKKIANINIKKNLNKEFTYIITVVLSITLFVSWLMSQLLDFNKEIIPIYFIFLSFIFYITIYIDNYLSKNHNFISNFLFNIKTRSLKLTEEEKNIIKESDFFYNFTTDKKDNLFLLNYLIEKNISSINDKNLEEFLIILKEHKLYKKYIDKICNKITNHANIMRIYYPEHYVLENFVFSKEELILSKFLNENQALEISILELLYKNSSLQDFKENKTFLNQLSIEYVSKKLLESYTLKEIIHSLFFNSSLHNPFYTLEILDILNLLNDENKILIKKYFIEQVLEQDDKHLIDNCHTEFFNSSFNLNLHNKDKLYDLRKKFPEEQLIANDNLKIIHM